MKPIIEETMQAEFESRRKKIAQWMQPHSVLILFSAEVYPRSGDTDFPFRQNNNFYYLTGFNEPESVCVLVKDENNVEFILFNRPRDKEKEIWDGRRLGQEGAVKILGADRAFSILDVDSQLPELLANKTTIYFQIGYNESHDQRVNDWLNKVRAKIRTGINAPTAIIDISHQLSEMRLIKSDDEIQQIKKVTHISAKAHARVMRCIKNLKTEQQVEAELMHEFLFHGCRTPAYPMIIGGGANACILHYTENDAPLESGQLLLIDAGAEYQHYAADITRTFPINGTYSKEQRAIYEIVLNAQKEGIKQVKPGTPWNKIQDVMVKIITQGLVDLTILEGSVDKLIETKAYRAFYMHNSGHWMGLDVHDVGAYKIDNEWRLLEPGMVLTIEPGIYIPENTPNVDPKWWNIGIRIEDDILVTPEGCEILTQDVPKEIDEVEALIQGKD